MKYSTFYFTKAKTKYEKEIEYLKSLRNKKQEI